jgi:hypothetical protein
MASVRTSSTLLWTRSLIGKGGQWWAVTPRLGWAEPHTAADGGTAVLLSSVASSAIGGGPAPAAERGRCYDFRCQELATDFFAFSLSYCPSSIGRAGASKIRRLILLLSVGWLPPYLRPSSAGLDLGTRVCFSLFTPSRVARNRGRVSSDEQAEPREMDFGLATVSVYGVSGTSWAMAHIKALNSRAMATSTWLACFPRVISCL